MPIDVDPILEEIEAFLVETSMPPTTFGQHAVSDPRFVFELRLGRECRRATRQRVREFIQRARSSGSSGDDKAADAADADSHQDAA